MVRCNEPAVGKSDALLAIDLDYDGAISAGHELFGEVTRLRNGDFARDGFDALRENDENSDGVLDALDGIWYRMLIWRDFNGDGVSQPDELYNLEEVGIVSISTNPRTVSWWQAGNEIRLESSAVNESGDELLVADVWFSVEYFETPVSQMFQVIEPKG